MMLTLQEITYIHPNRDLLFEDINLSILKHDKVALIGNNGVGKSTLLKILAGILQPSDGIIRAETRPYFVPQLLGQFNQKTIAEALQIDAKLRALYEILEGKLSEENLNRLEDDWAIEERCAIALKQWGLEDIDLNQKMLSLSGGQKAKVFLAGILIHRPNIVLLDEPSNHLDSESRRLLYDYIKSTTATLVVVSHDRTLLNLLDKVCELHKNGITLYGGNYEHYAEQKKIEGEALNHDVKSQEKALRKAKEVQKAALERQQKLDARGKKKQEKAGLPKILMNSLKNKAENSSSTMKGVHASKVNEMAQELSKLRLELPNIDQMKVGFNPTELHKGKVLIDAEQLNFSYKDQALFVKPLNFQINAGERIVLKGANGSGKTTLIKLILGQLSPQTGVLKRAAMNTIYIDQDYSLIDDQLSVYEQAQQANSGELQEHDVKIRLNRFLFTKTFWDKPCAALSGGEKMRLMLCCLIINVQAPDLIVLDEPTNNLDLQNIEILTNAINAYRGTLLVVTHDAYFLKQIGIERILALS